MAFRSLQMIFFFTLISSPVILGHSSDSPKSPLYLYLKHLQGCRKGDNVKGIHDIKVYLQRYGYLSNVQHTQNQTQSHVADDDHTFDDLLESAVKTYQKNFNLNASGILDAETIKQMSAPRCGVPDLFNGTKTVRSSEKRNQHSHGRHSHLHMVSHHNFFPGRPTWPPNKRHLSYVFIHNYPYFAIAPVARAFSQWSRVTYKKLTFSQTWDEQAADIRISFERRDHGDGSPFDGKLGVLAHAFWPTDGRLHMDADETWVVGAISGGFDVETVALHEIGHVLGLAHSTLKEAIMFPYIGAASTKGLSLDDIAGIRQLYY